MIIPYVLLLFVHLSILFSLQNDLLELQTLIDQYARLIPSNILQSYCQMKLKDFRRMFEKHVLQQSMNVNNNNSSTTTTIERIKFAKQRDEIRDVQGKFSSLKHVEKCQQTVRVIYLRDMSRRMLSFVIIEY